jgi:hypothetical protein
MRLGYKFSGERKLRGKYEAKSSLIINADCNGAAEILKKVARHLGLCLAKLGREALTTPHQYDLCQDLKKSPTQFVGEFDFSLALLYRFRIPVF